MVWFSNSSDTQFVSVGEKISNAKCVKVCIFIRNGWLGHSLQDYFKTLEIS